MVNRDQELDRLTPRLTYDERNLLAVYGRRRVGKTTLVTKALEMVPMPSVYYRKGITPASPGVRRAPSKPAVQQPL